MKWCVASMDEFYGAFSTKKDAVKEVMRHFDGFTVRKIARGYYEYSDQKILIWVANEFQARLHELRK